MTSAPPVGFELTECEIGTVRLLLAGRSCVDIALEQGVTAQAVHVRVWKARKKAGVRTLVQLGYWAALHEIHPVSTAAGGQ